MKRLYGFKWWLVDSILQNEATMRFSQKFNGADVNSVPPFFWNWLLDRLQEQPNWTPAIEGDDGRRMNRSQVMQLAQMRANDKKFGDIAPPRQEPPRQEPPQQQKSASPASGSLWTLGTVINVPGFQSGEHVVVTRSGEDWTAMNRQGETKEIKNANVRSSISSVKGDDGKPIQDMDPEKLWVKVAPHDDGGTQAPKTGVNPHILDREKLSEEQKEIDADFEKMMSSPGQNHMMINALAGTGKTTILKHLAWKYGKHGQKWLYLVFNAKNRAEAKEISGGYNKFPADWVEIYTTNSFLGMVMNLPENYSVIPQTDRMTTLSEDDKILQKARIMADSPKFQKLITDTYRIPDWEKLKDKVPGILAEFGVRPERARGNKKPFYDICMENIEFNIGLIRQNFQKLTLKLLGLLKSFSVDPRNKATLNKEVRAVFDRYDVAKHEDGTVEDGFFDTSLESIKERILGYKPNFRNILINVLDTLLNYDFIAKNYKDEIIGAATWMLEKSLPKGTDETYEVDKKGATRKLKVNLGDYRDFDDDIWFPTINSDKITFPKYDVVLADEVQDFNEGQKIMLKKLAEAGAKIVAVGDPNQSIYRFRGADSGAFGNLSEMLKAASHNKENWKEKNLSLNFRSREEVLKFANDNTIVKNLKPGKKFKEGDLPAEVTNQKIKYDEAFNEIAKERAAGKKIETAFISRTNAPLVHAALKLLGRGTPFVIIGKDISNDLVKHIKKIAGRDDRMPLLRFRDHLLEYEEKEVSKNSKYSTKQDYLTNLKDITLALKASIDQCIGEEEKQSHNKTVGDFKEWLKERLGSNSFDFDQSDEDQSDADLRAYRERMEREKPVVLTTAHKSKGLEFHRVYIVAVDKFTSSKPKQHPEDKVQDANAKYVAYTRAMHQLHILDEKGQPGKGKEPTRRQHGYDED